MNKYSQGYMSAHRKENEVLSGAIFIVSMICLVFALSALGGTF